MENAKETVGTATPIMTTVMGTKEVKSTPMNRGAYNIYRGWELPSDEDGSDDGYLIEYKDANSNHPNHSGYVSWSPKANYLTAYRENGSMTFGHAVVALKQGRRIARKGWYKGMFVFMQVPSQVSMDIVPKMTSLPQPVKDEFYRRFKFYQPDWDVDIEDMNSITYQNQLVAVYPNNKIFGWVASPSDILEEDWIILD